MNFYYNGNWRMDWGFGNPNKTAALIACLMIAIWAGAAIWKKGFWPVLAIFTALAWCLVQTYSRGGVVALLAGLMFLLLWVPRPWPKSRWIAATASLWVLGGFVLYAKAQTRYEKGLFTEDQSIGNRLILWKHVPEMMATAPWGWGWGKAGDSYTQWFQPTSQTVGYFNLINSHFTWMVELGWLVSILYVLAWLAVLLLCRPLTQSRLQALPLAVWITFGVGACFSAVAESPWLWIVPLIFLGYVLWERLRFRQWPSLSSFLVSGISSCGIVAILVLIGFATRSLPITFAGGVVTVGSGSDKTLILVDRKVLGPMYGHTLRSFLAKNRDQLNNHSFILVESPHDVSLPNANRLVICGRLDSRSHLSSYFEKGQPITFVNPSFFPEEAKLTDTLLGTTSVYFGEYTYLPSRSSWSNYPGIKTIQIDGASDFVPNWPQAILKANKT
jgi:hypothetical protein